MDCPKSSVKVFIERANRNGNHIEIAGWNHNFDISVGDGNHHKHPGTKWLWNRRQRDEQ